MLCIFDCFQNSQRIFCLLFYEPNAWHVVDTYYVIPSEFLFSDGTCIYQSSFEVITQLTFHLFNSKLFFYQILASATIPSFGRDFVLQLSPVTTLVDSNLTIIANNDSIECFSSFFIFLLNIVQANVTNNIFIYVIFFHPNQIFNSFLSLLGQFDIRQQFICIRRRTFKIGAL